jgi:hypothetical protein
MASMAQSSVSSLCTPSDETTATDQSHGSVVSSVTGKLLNTHPCCNVAIDGVANYVAVTVHPSRSAAVVPPPPEWVFEGLLHAFQTFYKINNSVKWYLTYDAEPGEEPTPPIDDPKWFPLDLESLQMSWCSIDNPWELRTINPGKMDNRTGRKRTYKSIFITVLMGPKFDLDQVLQLVLPSLASKNVQVKRKDVDALKSKTLFFIMGSPLDFDALAVCCRLHEALAKHEEWMQGNITHGYNAREYAVLELPPMVIVKRLPRMPESKDILPPEDIEVIQYLKSLCTMMHIEVSNNDQVHMRGLLAEFRARGKMNCITADADLLACVQSNNLEQGERLEFFRVVKAQMQYAHNHHCITFASVKFLMYPFTVEVEDPSVPHFKKSNLKRKILDFRHPSDDKKVFVGVMECTEEKERCVTCCNFKDDTNKAFVNGMGGHLAAFTYQYLRQVSATPSVASMLV